MRLRALFEQQLQTAYHVAPSKYNQTIKQNGIVGRDGIVYVWGDIEYASWFAKLHEDDGKPMTIWVVDVSGLDLERDPEAEDMSEWSTEFAVDQFGEAYIINKNRIEPERIIKTTKRII